MKKNLRCWAVAAVGAVAAIGFSSCAYDPYYSSASVGGSYSSGGYGDGYGYGGNSFSTSVFVSTGNPRWGYDPYCYSYYDYSSRRYYDPYLDGYYPIGYRPPVVYGVPHPYGWRPGGGYIRPPSRVSNGTVVNYRDRESRYRNSSYGWANQVRQGPVGGRVQGQRPAQSAYGRQMPQQNSYGRPTTGVRESQLRNQVSPGARQISRPNTRQESNARIPSRYNSPVTDLRTQARQGQRAPQYNPANNPQAQLNAQRARQQQAQMNAQRSGRAPQAQPKAQPGKRKAQPPVDGDNNRIRGYR